MKRESLIKSVLQRLLLIPKCAGIIRRLSMLLDRRNSSASKFGIEVALMYKPLVFIADRFLGALKRTNAQLVSDRTFVDTESGGNLFD